VREQLLPFLEAQVVVWLVVLLVDEGADVLMDDEGEGDLEVEVLLAVDVGDPVAELDLAEEAFGAEGLGLPSWVSGRVLLSYSVKMWLALRTFTTTVSSSGCSWKCSRKWKIFSRGWGWNSLFLVSR
jgi:hypothetical protein